MSRHFHVMHLVLWFCTLGAGMIVFLRHHIANPLLWTLPALFPIAAACMLPYMDIIKARVREYAPKVTQSIRQLVPTKSVEAEAPTAAVLNLPTNEKSGLDVVKAEPEAEAQVVLVGLPSSEDEEPEFDKSRQPFSKPGKPGSRLINAEDPFTIEVIGSRTEVEKPVATSTPSTPKPSFVKSMDPFRIEVVDRQDAEKMHTFVIPRKAVPLAGKAAVDDPFQNVIFDPRPQSRRSSRSYISALPVYSPPRVGHRRKSSYGISLIDPPKRARLPSADLDDLSMYRRSGHDYFDTAYDDMPNTAVV